jgi:hypothetical protein
MPCRRGTSQKAVLKTIRLMKYSRWYPKKKTPRPREGGGVLEDLEIGPDKEPLCQVRLHPKA